ETARQRRLLRLGLLLLPLAAWLWFRISSGSPVSPGFPSLPEPDLLLPIGLIAILGGVIILPMALAGRSPHVRLDPEEVNVRLKDVVGIGSAKEEVERTLSLFQAHKSFRDQMGGNPRKGVLFEGPPGTGKTYMAKAIAGEAGVPFLFVSSSAFQSMYYGQTNRKIRSYFRALRKEARAEGGAIGFIEEIDAIGAARSGMGSSTGREGISGVVNELLIQLQSFDEPTTGIRFRNWFVTVANRFLPSARRIDKMTMPPANVLVVGATNRASDLDPALIRPGRFVRSIHFDLPSRSGRREIIDFYLNQKRHVTELDVSEVRDRISAMTFGYSPVMLEHLLDEALVWALRRDATALDMHDIQQAKFTSELGLKQPVEYTFEERERIATHEAGHATVAHLVGAGRKLEVLSIIKRRDALGLLAHSDTEERFMTTQSELEALLQITMGGLVAEKQMFGEFGTGPAGDLHAATTMAARMVGSFGMADSLISMDAAIYPGANNIVAKVLGDKASRASVEEMLQTARTRVEAMLIEHHATVEALRDALLDRDELVAAEITDVIAAVSLEPVMDLTDSPG
ncbi:MAG: AAA family ATPase, partial [Acidimicrobiales bacterium]